MLEANKLLGILHKDRQVWTSCFPYLKINSRLPLDPYLNVRKHLLRCFSFENHYPRFSLERSNADTEYQIDVRFVLSVKLQHLIITGRNDGTS